MQQYEKKSPIRARTSSFPTALLLRLGGFATRRILQQLGVHLRGWQLHVFDDRTPDEAILHRLHVRKLRHVLDADVQQLDVQVLVD